MVGIIAILNVNTKNALKLALETQKIQFHSTVNPQF